MSGIIDSLGVEIEFTDVAQQGISRFVNEYRIPGVIGHDASCETTQITLGDIQIPEVNDMFVRRFLRKKHMGGEFITNIIESEQYGKSWFEPLELILKYLEDNGEKPSLVTGIHVHLQCGGPRYGVPLTVLKSLILIWRKIEAAVYRITAGEMGYSRGEKHLGYCYYRPLVPFNGPSVVRDRNDNNRLAFDINKLMNAKTTSEFFVSLCRDDLGEGQRYWATKYHALNLHSINQRGTVEFRTANLTLKPKYLYTWIRIFQQILGLAFSSYIHSLELDSRPDLPLGYNDDTFTYLDLADILMIRDEELLNNMQELWNITKWPEPLKGYQRSHLGVGLGQNMQETVVRYDKVRADLIPEIIKPSEKIYLPDELANPDIRTNALEHAHRRHAETPRGPVDFAEWNNNRRLFNTIRIDGVDRARTLNEIIDRRGAA